MMDANVIVPVILFVLLSPGVLLTLPSRTSRFAVLVHAVIFGLVYMTLRRGFPQFY